MIIPVTAFSINQHRTMSGHFGLLRHSPTLRFHRARRHDVHTQLAGLVRGAARYQHHHPFHPLFTVAHAHLGLYGLRWWCLVPSISSCRASQAANGLIRS